MHTEKDKKTNFFGIKDNDDKFYESSPNEKPIKNIFSNIKKDKEPTILSETPNTKFMTPSQNINNNSQNIQLFTPNMYHLGGNQNFMTPNVGPFNPNSTNNMFNTPIINQTPYVFGNKFDKDSKTKKEEKEEESKLDEFKPDDLVEFFSMTDEWSDVYLISKKCDLEFVQSNGRIYIKEGKELDENNLTKDSNDEEEIYKDHHADEFELNVKALLVQREELFNEILAVCYHQDKINKLISSSKHKSMSEYLYEYGLICLKKNFILIKHCPPFIIFKEEHDTKDMCVIMLKDKKTNLKYLLIIGYFRIITFPCIIHYLKQFVDIYANEIGKQFEYDDIYDRYKIE